MSSQPGNKNKHVEQVEQVTSARFVGRRRTLNREGRTGRWVHYLRCDCRYEVITTPTLLEQCGTWSCCIEAREDRVLSETPPTEPRGVVKIDVAMSSSLSEKRRVLVCVRDRHALGTENGVGKLSFYDIRPIIICGR
ncbi:hypothetical protein quinque_001829 [Culex quinquefasciatus]